MSRAVERSGLWAGLAGALLAGGLVVTAIFGLAVAVLGATFTGCQSGASATGTSSGPAPSAYALQSIPPARLALYEQAGARFDVDWSFLASIGAQECANGDCAGVNSSGCAGPMQIAYVRGSALVVAEGRIQDAVVGAIRKKKMQELVEPFLPRAAGALKAPELAQLLSQGAVVPIDTRDEGAFKRAHLPRAVNMPIEGIEARLAELHMLPGQPVLYCRSGDKTKELSEKLAEQGMPVAFLEGGMLAWEADGLPIERVR